MDLRVPEAALRYGFVNEPVGTHSSRSMMLAEISALFAASDPKADYETLRRLVVEENVTLKRTRANREAVFRRLRELYGLRRALPLYRALRTLWPTAPSEQPLLALLCASARDPLLRATAPVVLAQLPGTLVAPQQLSEAVHDAFPDRYGTIPLASIGRHTLATWTRSGHVVGKMPKIRSRADAGPAAATYALLLGYLCGARGAALFESSWARLLDVAPHQADALAFAASQRGWLEYRRLGEVVELRFPLLTGGERSPVGA